MKGGEEVAVAHMSLAAQPVSVPQLTVDPNYL